MALQNDEEKPLDPAQERLRKKLVRLLLISGGIMVLGFIAVFAAIVHKVSTNGDGASVAEDSAGAFSGKPVEATIPVPPGSRVLSTELDGDRALIRLEALDGRVSFVLVDLATGRVLGRYAIEGK